MRHLVVSLFVFSLLLPLKTGAFTPGLFRVMEIGEKAQMNEQASEPTPDVRLNLVVEADTYAPSFYQGRAEPIAGSVMRLTAISDQSSRVSSYRWLIGGRFINDSRQTVQITAPVGTSEVLIDVTAMDENGNAIGRTTEYVPLSSPSLSFYEVNPLRGASSVAIGQRLNLIGDEVLVRGEPYFINNQSLGALYATWNTGDLEKVVSENWQTLTILRTENVPSTRITLQARNSNTLSENISGSFILGI